MGDYFFSHCYEKISQVYVAPLLDDNFLNKVCNVSELIKIEITHDKHFFQIITYANSREYQTENWPLAAISRVNKPIHNMLCLVLARVNGLVITQPF